MRWRKRGLIYAPRGDRWWARSYATMPTVEALDESTLRVYFASLDDQRFGRIGFVDVDASDPANLRQEGSEPVLDLGALGTFDDSGVNPACVLTVAGRRWLYYVGWQRCERVPYMLFSGLARADDEGRLERVAAVPVLDRTPAEPYLRAAPCVVRENGGFRAWYVSGLGWDWIGDRHYPVYSVRHAASVDGIDWRAEETVCLAFADADEFGFGRPWVVRDADRYRMWYSIRSRARPYRIGYAESADGLTWVRRDDQVGIEPSSSGWDAEMVCYPCVVDAAGERYLFYNGNRHGQSGFGYAVLER